jgi:hypothetical protein
MTFDLALPVSIAPRNPDDGHAGGRTELISGEEVVFVSPVRFRPGEKIRLFIRMGDAAAEAECRARVMDSREAYGVEGAAFRTSACFVRSPKIVKPDVFAFAGM